MPPFSRDDVAVGLRFLAALPRFLRTPLSLDAMRAIVRERFARREARFLACVARARALPGSPYARLLDHAGCTQEDVAAAVRRDGVEGALATLHAAGVCLSGDEFKGRRAAAGYWPEATGRISSGLRLTGRPARLACAAMKQAYSCQLAAPAAAR